ncbi:MAG: putative toxin-antitoxin system toxin component, PIN family [Terriglobales bacterium]
MKNVRVVLDTNVVVSAHLTSDGFERHVLDLVLAGKLQLIVSQQILEEYDGVLRRPKFRIDRRRVRRALGFLRAAALVVRPHRELKVTRDPADNRFLECAEAGKADYIVTGNKRHFPDKWRRTQIVNSRELLEWIVPLLKR